MGPPPFDHAAESASQELERLRVDVNLFMNRRAWRWLTCWGRLEFWAIASYRLERALFLISGSSWPLTKHLVRPLIAIIRPPTVDISCEARIGPGMSIPHPALGIVVSRHAVIGDRVTLTGGNCIGIRREFVAGDELVIGDDVNLGANAIVLGPIRIGDRVMVGAGSVATRDLPDNATLRPVDCYARIRGSA